MSLNRWQQIEEIFQAALDLPPPERLGFVSANCPNDPELRREIEKLLADYIQPKVLSNRPSGPTVIF